MRLRPVSRKRLKKALSRRKRLKWWRSLGGAAHEVARGGLVTSGAHGAQAHGLPCATLRDLRRIQASSVTIKAGGSSATAKLAIGGHQFRDVDPAVWLANPPLLMLADTLWDSPASRGEHVEAWRLAKRELEGVPRVRAWRRVRGPVGAAFLHLDRVNATWKKPFVVTLFDKDIYLLEVPPRALSSIIREHARRHYDRILIASWATEHRWDIPSVISKYSNGIDWSLVRDVLRSKRGGLTHLERKAYMALVTGAAWPEERRWLSGGMLPTGSCLACLMEIGSMDHKINRCGAIEQEITWMKLAGRKIRPPRGEAELAPLSVFGLPPLLRDNCPRELSIREGAVPRATSGKIFGDASGVGQRNQTPEIVTWSIATLGSDGASLQHSMGGTCSGWYPSVPRGELQALVEALEVALIPATYVGDCQFVTDGLTAGIPRSLASSSSSHADLWRRARWLLRDHGPGIDCIKVKAHRLRGHVEAEGHAEGLQLWLGNQFADTTAKGLALRLWEGVRAEADRRTTMIDDFVGSMARSGICARLSQSALDSLKLPRVSKRRRFNKATGFQCGDHTLAPMTSGNGQWCTKCKLITRTAASYKSLAARPCQGEVLLGIHQSHHLRWSVGVTWCERCGYYMSRLPRALRQPCTGAPRTVAARNVLRRLRCGLPPTTAAYLKRAAAEDDWASGLDAIFQDQRVHEGLTSTGPAGATRAHADDGGNEAGHTTRPTRSRAARADADDAVPVGTNSSPPRRADHLSLQLHTPTSASGAAREDAAERQNAGHPGDGNASTALSTRRSASQPPAVRTTAYRTILHRDEVLGDDEPALRRPPAPPRRVPPGDRVHAASPAAAPRRHRREPQDRDVAHNAGPRIHDAISVTQGPADSPIVPSSSAGGAYERSLGGGHARRPPTPPPRCIRDP